ncbi:MAG: hypothetical protein R6X34_00275 [Chloroflexota bacterium]
MNMKYHTLPRLAASLILAAGLLCLLALWLVTTPVQAQVTDQITVDKQLGRANPVVRVGEYLTFTIRIRNQSQFTVTTLPLSDNFNNAVLAYVDASVPPDSVDTAAGAIEWNDLTTFFGDLAPGAEVTVIVGFIAEHPAPVVVNRAEVHDALGDEGSVPGGGDDSDEGESIGGASPVDKKLIGGVIPEVGMPLTFTISITNDGYTTMTVVPLLEDYDPDFLQFSFAEPPPDAVDEVSGELTWSDLTLWLGDVGPMQAISLTAVFTALAPIDITTNSASVANAKDWYGNDLAAGADDVPITIIGQDQQQTPTPAATTQATATPGSGGGEAAPTATAAATTTAAATQAAMQMPETGIPPAAPLWPTFLLMALAALLPAVGWLIWQRRSKS